MKEVPPKLPLRFFRWFCHPKLRDSIEGDLMELYEERRAKSGKVKADALFFKDVLLLFRPGIIRPAEGYQQLNNYGMLKNYLKISWRSLLKQKMYSFIKIGGFAIGVAACLLIALFIKDELSYDKHYANHKQLYRVLAVITENGDIKKGVAFPAPMALAVKEDFPEVVNTGRYNNSELFGAGASEVRAADAEDNAYDEGFVYFDQSLIDMLQLKFIYGNPQKALSQPGAIVITKRKADKYFPNEDPVGKALVVNNKADKPYTVGGVIEDFKSTSHLQFDFLIGMEGLEFWNGEQKTWDASNYATYIQVAEGTDAKSLEEKLSNGIIEKYYIPMMTKSGRSLDDVKKFFTETQAHLELQPINEIHLFSEGVDDKLNYGDIRIVWLFGGIALFILLIAAINFINLSTARSANRAKEVGLRKVVGSLRGNIINQFLSESVMFSAISFVLGLAIASIMLQYFNSISGKSISIPWMEWWFVPSLLGLSVVVGVIAGIYPSFYLSAFKPIQVLKGALTQGSKSSPLRSSLVIFQFTISIILLIGTMVIQKQMNFILNKKIGFEKDQVLLLQGTGTLGTQVVAFADELRATSHVVEVSTGDYLPVRGSKRNGNSFWNEGRENIDPNVTSQFWRVDPYYVNTLGLKIVEGRDFNRDLASDSSAIIINQKMAKELGGNMLGKRITNYGGLWTVIGIVEDFHYESLREDIRPIAMVLGTEASVLAVKLKAGDMSESIQSITTVWDKFAPHQPIRYSFLDDRYAAMYNDVQRMGKIFTSFSILAIVVACLGLFALSAFMVEQRSKEISVRLVLGASVNSVFQLLTWDFLRLVLISIVIAAPISWYMMSRWLEDYAYRTDIGWDVFVVSGITSVLIALITISFQSIKAAVMNPVKGLRSE
ncbi:MAG: ABC transporter permease [Cytophagales bacterium]|nr:ABC transporter permease [Cytophagales bacterium]